MEFYPTVVQPGPAPGNWRDAAAARAWAKVLGVPETDVLEAIRGAGACAEAVLFYLNIPD
jgi:hypothetical protein